jgi:4'-phosphopantetheinyl transferase
MPATPTEFGQVESLALPHPAGSISVSVASVPLTGFEALKARRQEFLSPQELAYFDGRKFERKQRSYLSGRHAAKLALAHFVPGSRPCEIDIYPGVFDQPLVRMPSGEVPGITITHCDDLAMALAFPVSHPMGIDVERIDPAMVATMKTQMCAAELAWAATDEPRRCALIWTAKEALSKTLKCGLTTAFDLLEVEGWQSTAHGWRGTYRHFKQYRSHSWLGREHALSLTLPIPLLMPDGSDLRPLLT